MSIIGIERHCSVVPGWSLDNEISCLEQNESCAVLLILLVYTCRKTQYKTEMMMIMMMKIILMIMQS